MTSPWLVWGLVIVIITLLLVGGLLFYPRSEEPRVAILGFTSRAQNDPQNLIGVELTSRLSTYLGAPPAVELVANRDVADLSRHLSHGPVAKTLNDIRTEAMSALGANSAIGGSYTLEGSNITWEGSVYGPQGTSIARFSRNGSDAELDMLAAQVAEDIRKTLKKASIPESYAQKLRALYPQDKDALESYFSGLQHLLLLEGDQARKDLEHAKNKVPDNALVRSALAEAWELLRHDDEALREANAAAKLASAADIPKEYKLLTKARAAEMDKKWDDAADSYRSLFDLVSQPLDMVFA